MRELEEKLLAELSAVTGNILDNDSIILSLESIKKETSEVAAEVLIMSLVAVVYCCGVAWRA